MFALSRVEDICADRDFSSGSDWSALAAISRTEFPPDAEALGVKRSWRIHLGYRQDSKEQAKKEDSSVEAKEVRTERFLYSSQLSSVKPFFLQFFLSANRQST